MKKLFAIPLLIGICLLLISCQKDKISKLYERLPELPADIAKNIDTSTMTSRVASVYVGPVQDTGSVALAPCCSITVEREMKVTFTHTKCRPLFDFVVVDFESLVLSQEKRDDEKSSSQMGAPGSQLQYHKLTGLEINPNLKLIICETSNGPWDATLTENRACVGFTPHQTLVIAPHGELVVFQWNGGVENHPASVGLVSCRQAATIRSLCPGSISTCSCLSSFCQANNPCDCGISDQW